MSEISKAAKKYLIDSVTVQGLKTIFLVLTTSLRLNVFEWFNQDFIGFEDEDICVEFINGTKIVFSSPMYGGGKAEKLNDSNYVEVEERF